MPFLSPLARRWRARLGRQEGFTMIAMMGALTIAASVSVAAFAAAGGDLNLARYDQDSKTAYAAAEGGINEYLFHLNQENAYWARCTNVPAPAKVNQPWNGLGADPRQWRTIPSSSTQYTIELLPANGNAQCVEGDAQNTMIDAATSTFRIRSTGRSNKAKRSIVATFRRRGFLDYLYFTDLETSDPTWYEVDSAGRQTNPDLSAWASSRCTKYWRQGRGSERYNGQIFWFDNRWRSWSDICTEIQFAPGDVIAGPFHTNDEILVCGAPTFGRMNRGDRVEVSGPGWRGSGACGGNNPVFLGTWTPNAPILTLPPSDTALRSVADPAYRFTGRTTIRLNGNSMTVNGTNMALPANGVIYVQNGSCGQGYRPLDPYNNSTGCADVYVRGSYSQSLTIASEKDVIVDEDVTRSGDVMLGLIANNFVRVYHPVTNFTINQSNGSIRCTNSGGPGSIRIDAAILALNHSFTVDNYYCGNPTGILTVNGVIAQKHRGPVGRGGSSIVNGYVKNYNYDDRLRFRSPPHFLDPVQSSWRIARFTEQNPPR